MKEIIKESFKFQIGKKLQELRKLNNFNQEEVAKYLELSRVSIVNIEKGKQAISLLDAVLLCKLYNISLEEFSNGFIIKEETTFTKRHDVKRDLKMAKAVARIKRMVSFLEANLNSETYLTGEEDLDM